MPKRQIVQVELVVMIAPGLSVRRDARDKTGARQGTKLAGVGQAATVVIMLRLILDMPIAFDWLKENFGD